MDTPEHRRFFRQLLTTSGLLALASTAFIMGNGGLATFAPIPGWRGVVGVTALDVHQATLSAFYVAGVTRLFWQTRARLLRSLVAVGRTGLTTYLIDTAFGVLLFLGYGLG